jgi:hypothetical protein
MAAEALPKPGLGRKLACLQAGATAIVFMVEDPARKFGQWKPERPSILTVGASFERRRTGLKEMSPNVYRKRKQQMFRGLIGYNL